MRDAACDAFYFSLADEMLPAKVGAKWSSAALLLRLRLAGQHEQP
jgi:hypothetical protein